MLTLTARGRARGFFWFDVLTGYRIRDYLGDMYGDLLEVLKEDGSSGHRPIPKEFLAQLNDAIPIQAMEKAIRSLRASCACVRTSSRTGKCLTSIAGRIGRNARNPVLRISARPCFSWALVPCGIAWNGVPHHVGTLEKLAAHGLKGLSNSQPSCRALWGRGYLQVATPNYMLAGFYSPASIARTKSFHVIDPGLQLLHGGSEEHSRLMTSS